MKDAAEEYLEINNSINKGSLQFSCERLDLLMQSNEVCRGEFTIYGIAGEKAKGYLYPEDIRMSCNGQEFSGNEITVQYRFDSTGMEEGDSCTGAFHIVSNKGEYYLPYSINIAHSAVNTSLGNARNLFHFTNLAKSNWKEAVQLFYSGYFPQLLTGNDRQYFSIYKGLAKDSGNEQNVEEFLIEIHKKQQTEFSIDRENIILANPEETSEEKIIISKNGWGYLRLRVAADGDFLTVEKEYLTEDDFLGNKCSLSIYIHRSLLHGGNNYGNVKLIHAHGQLELPVTAVLGLRRDKKEGQIREQELNLQLIKSYIDFRTKKKNTSSWVKENQTIVEMLIRLDQDNPVYRLYQAQLLITRERYNEAKWVLDHVEERLRVSYVTPQVHCYYLYLTTLYQRNEGYINEVTEEIENVYSQDNGNWRIAWLLLYLREDYARNPSAKWELLEDQFRQNSNSPVLYVEAAYLVNSEPYLLQRLEGFELQVLNFAVKQGILAKNVIPQIQNLFRQVKSYSDQLFNILKECYRLSAEDETLQKICELLIKGSRTGERYFKWYGLGVKRQLRITRLYEYYMLSIPLEYTEELPRLVMMYFAYEANLGYQRNAFLYANIIRHEEQFPEMVLSYRKQMLLFVQEQIVKGHINRDLAFLYRSILPPDQIEETQIKALAPLLFVRQITVEDETIRQVIVIHENLKGEVRYPTVNGKAMVAVFGEPYHIFLQDGSGNRYSGNYQMDAFMDPKEYLLALCSTEMPLLGCDMFICEGNSEFIAVTEQNASNFAKLVRSEQVREDFKRNIRVKLIQYYFENDCIRELDACLEEINADGMTAEERSEFIHFMVVRGVYDKAVGWIRKYGAEGVSEKTLVRLCSRVIYRTEFKEDEFLLRLCHMIFLRNRYDENILKYLVTYYRGDTKEMRDIWNAAGNFDVDTYKISEHILVQMLYTGCFISEGVSIFKSYVKAGAKTTIKRAFLVHCAHEYFVDDAVMPDEVFIYLKKMLVENKEADDICKLAFLKYYAEYGKKITEDMISGICQMLEEFLRKNICFAFFQEYRHLIPKLEILADQTFLEYRVKEDCKVYIHYVVEHGGEETFTDYRREEMKKLYDRIYSKSFILFYGERVQYYITEESEEKEELTTSGALAGNGVCVGQAENRYSMLNDICIAGMMQDYDTLQEMAADFCKKEYMTKQLFRIV